MVIWELVEISFIHPSEIIGKLNPVKVDTEGLKRKSSADPLVPRVLVILRILLSHQYEDVFAVVPAKHVLLLRAISVVVSVVRRSTCHCVLLISNAAFASTRTERQYDP